MKVVAENKQQLTRLAKDLIARTRARDMGTLVYELYADSDETFYWLEK
jgi:quinol monooxygenase YgiN